MSPILAMLLVAQTPTNEVPFRTLAFGSSSQIKEGGAIVMRDAASFEAYRKRMGLDDAKKPKVDWGKEQAVAIHAEGTTGYFSASIHVVKVRKEKDGSLVVDVALDRGNRPATPLPGVTRLPKKDGLYTLIVVPPAKGEVRLRVVAQPASSGDRSDTPGRR